MRWVGFVRAVMQGRDGLHRDVLLSLVGDAGGGDPVTVLTTGNVLFTARKPSLSQVVGRMEASLEQVVGRETPVIVRSLNWLQEFVSVAPFTDEQLAELECEVGFMSERLPSLDVSRLPDLKRTTVVAVHDHELVTARPRDGAQRPHVNELLHRATGSRAVTARAWSTLARIADRG